MDNNLSLVYVIFNKISAIFLLILISPLMLVIGLIIKISSKGKIIFVQKRMGHNKRIFNFYKFRTMVEDADKLKEKYRKMSHADGPVFKIENDPRFTKFGRFLSKSHLDELPQLWNVVKGDMFIVGFRPPTLEEVERYKKWQMRRFNGWPGITSVWAVNGGHSKFTFDEWIRSDIEYEHSRSIFKDISLILRTFFILLRRLTSH